MLQILMKTFENNGKSISENFVKLNLKQNLYSIFIWSSYVRRNSIFNNRVKQLRVMIES